MLERIDALEQRLHTLEAVAAIKDLKSYYWQMVDRQRIEEVRACITFDAFIDMDGVPCNTRDLFVDFIGRAGCRPGLYNLHAGQNPRIELSSPDAASGVWDTFFTSIDVGAQLTIQMTGEYLDTYVRVDGRWLMASIRFRQTSFLMTQIDAAGQGKVLSMGQNNTVAFGT